MIKKEVPKAIYDILKDTSESISQFYHEKLKQAITKLENIPELKNDPGFKAYCMMLSHINPIAAIIAANVEKLVCSHGLSNTSSLEEDKKIKAHITDQTLEHIKEIVRFMQDNEIISIQRMN